MDQSSSQNKLVAQVRLGQQVALFLLERIRLGEFLPGDRLPSERDLCEDLGVSRTALREGLRWLEYEKYVEIRRGKHGGTVILPTSPEVALERIDGQVTELVELLEYRLLIEPRAAELAALRIRDHQLDRIRTLHRRHMTDPGLSRAEARAIDVEMHDVIANASGNRYLAQAIRDVRARLNVGLDLTGHTLTRARKSRTGHAQIIDALEHGDAAAARTFMKRHVAATNESILLALGEHGIDVNGVVRESAIDSHIRVPRADNNADSQERMRAISATER